MTLAAAVPRTCIVRATRWVTTIGNWFRAKLLQQFRLLFRYQQYETSKIIVMALVNHEFTLRPTQRRI